MGGYDSSAVLGGHFARVAQAAPLDQVSYVDLHTFLPYNLLEYGDRMSMAHALELRLPFTDHHLVEFSMRLPAELKLRGRQTKYLLREAVRSLLPAEILERPKLGLNPPLGMWMRRELAPLRSYARRVGDVPSGSPGRGPGRASGGGAMGGTLYWLQAGGCGGKGDRSRFTGSKHNRQRKRRSGREFR